MFRAGCGIRLFRFLIIVFASTLYTTLCLLASLSLTYLAVYSVLEHDDYLCTTNDATEIQGVYNWHCSSDV